MTRRTPPGARGPYDTPTPRGVISRFSPRGWATLEETQHIMEQMAHSAISALPAVITCTLIIWAVIIGVCWKVQ